MFFSFPKFMLNESPLPFGSIQGFSLIKRIRCP
jgi:hypothetical protein